MSFARRTSSTWGRHPSLALLRPIRSLLRRDGGTRRILVESYLVVAAVRLALTVVPYAALRRLRRPVVRLVTARSTRPFDERSVVDAVRIASRHVTRATCLTQAIALHLMLARRGADSELVVGVASTEGRFEAHAWVDRDGRVLIGGDVAGFNQLLRVGRSPR
jgi:hypothetical protein